MSLKDKFKNLTTAGKARANELHNKHGWSLKDSISHARSVDIFAAVLTILVLIGVGVGIAQCSSYQKKLTCTHQNYKIDTIWFDSIQEIAVVKCKDCGQDKYLKCNKTTNVLYEATCQSEGSQEIIVVPVDHPEYIFKKTKTINMTSCKNITIISPRVESTCVTPGETETTQCTLCKKIYPGSPLPLVEHKLKDVGYVAPTCTTKGVTSIKECSVCEYTEGTHEEIALLPHNYLEEDKYFIEETYDQGGHIIGVCHDCDHEELLEYTSLPLVSDFFEYELDNETKTAKLTSIKSANKELVVPGKINNYPVNEISSTLFKDNTNIEKITIEEGVKIINYEAFKNCSSLKEILFPTTLESIEESAFENCNEIRKVIINTGIIKTKAFESCSNLRIVETGANVRLQNDSFYNCKKLIFFKFPDNYGNGRRNVFDSKGKYGSSIDDIDSYVTLTSGNFSLLDDYFKGETSEDVIINEYGFYYYIDSLDKCNLLSIDRPETNVVIPSCINYVTSNTFRGMEDELDSIVVPNTVSKIRPTNMFFKNLQIYFEGEDCLGKNYEIGGTITDSSTNETITYKSIRYIYSETNKEEGGPYWYYDENKNIVKHEYPYINFGNIDYFAYGDGFTYGYNGSSYYSNTYPNLIQTNLGLKSYTTKGTDKATFTWFENGSRLCNYIPSYSMISPKIVSVMCGTNDFLNNAPLGELNNEDPTTFYGSVQYNIDKFIKNYSNIFLFFITPLKQFKVKETNDVGASLEDYVNIIKEVCELNNIPVLDLYNLVDFSSTTDSSADGIYPSEEFTKDVITPIISKYIEGNYKEFVLKNA